MKRNDIQFDARLQRALTSIPPPGEGRGCHAALLGVANLCARRRIAPEEAVARIRANIPAGDRKVDDREITEAVQKAYREAGGGRPVVLPPKAPPAIADGKAALEAMVARGRGVTEEELRKASPLPLPSEPVQAAQLLLMRLYRFDEYLYIGPHDGAGILNESIRPAGAWVQHLQAGEVAWPHIMPNPLSGQPAKTKDGKDSLRCDAAVAGFRYALVEFDNLPLADQLAFWQGIDLPVVALIHTGGKSVHGWVDAWAYAGRELKTAEDWQGVIKVKLFDQYLIPLGVDRACRNPSRLSRIPGHFRADKGQWQRLLWLAPPQGGAQ